MTRRLSQHRVHHRFRPSTVFEVGRAKPKIVPHRTKRFPACVHDRGSNGGPLSDCHIPFQAMTGMRDRCGITRLDDLCHRAICLLTAGGDRVGGPCKGLAHPGNFEPRVHDVGHARQSVGPAEQLPIDRDTVERGAKIFREAS